MIRTIAVALALLFSLPAWADLKIENIRATHGPLGPPRASLEAYPGDQIILQYTIRGLKTDQDGKINCDMGLKVTNAEGKVVIEQKSPIVELMAFGHESTAADAAVDVGPDTLPGDYTLSVTLKDNIGSGTAALERKITCRKPDFAIVRPRFAYDPDGKTPAALSSLTAGQRIVFRLPVVGFDRSQKKYDLALAMEIFDEQGKAQMPKPLSGDAASDDETVVGRNNVFTFTGFFTCNRTGTFKIKYTVTDRLTKKTATLEVPVKVQE